MDRTNDRRMRRRFQELGTFWRRVFLLLAESSPRLSMLAGALTILEAGLAITGLYLIKELIDTFTLSFENQEAEAGDVYLLLVLVGSVLVLAAIAQLIAAMVRSAQSLFVRDHVDRRLQEHALSVDLAFYESPAYHDLLFRAKHAGPHRPAQLVTSMILGGRAVIYLVAILIMIVAIDMRLVLPLVASIGMVLLVRLKFTRVLFDWQYQRAKQERRAAYLDMLMTTDVYAKEVRIAGLGSYFSQAYQALRRTLRERQLLIEKRRALSDSAAAIIGVIMFCGSAAFLVAQARTGAVSVGDLVLFVLLFRRAETTGRDLITQLSKLYDDRLYLDQLFRFFEIEPVVRPCALPKPLPPQIQEGIAFEGVSFRYPGTDRWVLHNIDFTLPPARITGLIGANGSGKTSLIKLLCRLYDPSEGRITLDGVDIRSLDLDRYRQLFAVIFQDFARYADPATENIRLGDVRRSYSAEAMENAARKAGADSFLETLPEGYDTPLTRLFDEGRELSFGEWQRIALARTFYADSPFMVMDEPTSALDAAVEAEIFDDFRDRLEGRAALVISHRLSTLRQADQCYVLREGRVLEYGTHAKLVEGSGLYAELFRKKREQYVVPEARSP